MPTLDIMAIGLKLSASVLKYSLSNGPIWEAQLTKNSEEIFGTYLINYINY